MWKPPESPQWIEIDAKALVHNVGVFRSILSPKTQLLSVVKANAYGHGMAEVARVLEGSVDWFGVHSATEARRLRREGIGGPILIMGFVPRGELRDLDSETHLLISSETALGWVADYRDSTGISLPIHLKVDTGTKRQGLQASRIEPALNEARRRGLEVVGLATHFANIEDTLEHQFARVQLDRFRACVEVVTRVLGEAPPLIHAACSAASLLFRETDFSLARVGISLYGHWPSRETRLSWNLEHGRGGPELKPVLSWRTVVGQLQPVERGETVGYGRTWTALRPTVLAVIPVGYADGYPRSLGNGARVGIHGREAPVVGRVCMNVFMADVTDIPEVAIGDRVTLLGTDGEVDLAADDLAALAGTINYEFLARLSPSIPRCVRS